MMIFAPMEQNWSLCAILNSNAYIGLLHLLMPRGGRDLDQTLKYEKGYVSSVPIPNTNEENSNSLQQYAINYRQSVFNLKNKNETSHYFDVPELIHSWSQSMRESISNWLTGVDDALAVLKNVETMIDTLAYDLYGMDTDDRNAIDASLGDRPSRIGSVETDPRRLTSSLLSWCVGVAFSRFDVRYGTGEKTLPPQPDPFAPLPVCSPGMLTGDDGLPLAAPPDGYPIEVDADGIIVDDPGHPDDIVARVRQVIDTVFPANPHAIEAEIRSLLGAADLRDYLRKTGAGGFFDDHIKRYSKSRRKAPIYWLLQSSRKSYGIWLYYPRMNADTLHLALTRYAAPRAERERRHLDELLKRRNSTDDPTEQRRLDAEVERTEALVTELDQFRDRLQAAADLYLVPDHDDGVVLTIAPLRELVPWREAATYWQALLDGKYPWSSISKQLHEKGLVRGRRA